MKGNRSQLKPFECHPSRGRGSNGRDLRLPVLWLVPVASLVLTGCWGTRELDLMPAPLVHQQHGASACGGIAETSCCADIHFATNRPAVRGDRHPFYRNGSERRLHLGVAKVRLGDKSMRLEELVELSTRAERPKEIPLRIEQTIEIEMGDRTQDSALTASINRSLQRCSRKDLTIFVPGAQSSFYKSCAHATQLQHFMLGQGAIVTFSWPSTGRFVGYPRDTRYARESVGHLADLIEQLAASTDAKTINIFSYSAGAQVTAPALAELRVRHPGESADELRRRFRIGNVYLASPDVSAEAFYTQYLPAFRDLVGRTTFTYHRQDPFLKASHRYLGEARLGRPSGGFGKAKELAWLKQGAAHPSVDAIDLEFACVERPVEFCAHGAWYSNPWVSSDLVV